MKTKINKVDISNEIDKKNLEIFYENIYINAFPNKNEREPLSRIVDVIGRNSPKWFCSCNLAFIDNTCCGGIIYDWFENSYTASVEFATVDPQFRRHKIGSLLFESVITNLHNIGKFPPFIFAEIETDPEAEPARKFWRQFGFRRLDCDYIQPALDSEKDIVKNLGLWVKPMNDPQTDTMPGEIVSSFIFDYTLNAFDILKPLENQEVIHTIKSIGVDVKLEATGVTPQDVKAFIEARKAK